MKERKQGEVVMTASGLLGVGGRFQMGGQGTSLLLERVGGRYLMKRRQL